ncbi:acylglycerol kinase, mitochondrial [Brienomyrus brachyistius]|uniref:acylglycerol kinase, mitochondrial n=1 Tax=Brienomyrus brachyistius TaxID=42636 RepID=UPI0020B43E37|nr:acylglycerol kinase, mitochondrial [Brienomyrus brachyistius]
MARVVKVLRTLRNHWKKSTFAFCVLSYGGHWLYGKHCDSVLRREACLEAQEFGRQLILPQEQLKKATVILNPAACNGKANKLFEKNAAPILHLAGVQVTLVKTDYEGQAKKLMELLEHTDMLIVAGGDGTLQEVITGLLRRNDQDSFRKIPIGFIPLGSQNSLNQSLYLPTDNPVKSITSAALSILRGETMPLDVLQIKGEKDQPVFALLGVRWGAFRDVSTSISKYWYLGPLKTKAAHWFSTLREWPQNKQVSLSYLGPTPRPPDEPTEKPPRPPLVHRIIRRLRLYWSPAVEEPPREEPEVWVQEEVSTAELSISTHNRNPALERPTDSMLVCLEPDSLTVGEFITIGTEKTGDPHLCSARGEQLQASVCRIGLPKEGVGFYNIDNEEYEAMAVEVRLLPRKLRFFCSAERRDQLLSEPH